MIAVCQYPRDASLSPACVVFQSPDGGLFARLRPRRLIPSDRSAVQNTVTHFSPVCPPSASSAVGWQRGVGPLLVAHGAVAPGGAEVQPAGRRRGEVSNGAGRPLRGGGESGPHSASGEAGVCMHSSVEAYTSCTETRLSKYVNAILITRFTSVANCSNDAVQQVHAG